MARILDLVVGHQTQIERFLEGAESGRLASTFIFAGPLGIGKRKVALGLLQALVCETNSRACGQCAACLRIEKEQSESLLLIEPQGTQIKIDQSREVIQFASLKQWGKARGVIIDQAELMNAAAANALLKTLEEPPENTYFFMVTSSLGRLLPTLRSRSQTFRFSPLLNEQVAQLVPAEPWVISAAQGSPGRAQALVDSDLHENQKKWLALLAQGASSSSSLKGVGEVKDIIGSKEEALFLSKTSQYLIRDLMVRCSGQGEYLLGDASQTFRVEEAEALEELWGKSQRLEWDVLGNVDRTLAFENFAMDFGALVSV